MLFLRSGTTTVVIIKFSLNGTRTIINMETYTENTHTA